MKPGQVLIAKATAGEVSAQCRLAEVLMSAESTRGYQRALPWLRRAARSGDRWAEYHLGLIYDHGWAGRRDRGRAAHWYERSAARGYASAQLNLGVLLARRPGRGRDLRRAVQLYRRAARQGRSAAAYNLGLYYARGRGVPRSLSRARYWYRRAADLGDRAARRMLQSLGWKVNANRGTRATASPRAAGSRAAFRSRAGS